MAKRLVVALATIALVLGASVHIASAHASLQRATIAPNQVFHAGHTPKVVRAFFAESLDPNKSFIAIFENQADHGLVSDKQHSTVNFKNPKEMDLPLPKIDPGKYYLLWYTHSAEDGHFAAGVRYFRVVK